MKIAFKNEIKNFGSYPGMKYHANKGGASFFITRGKLYEKINS